MTTPAAYASALAGLPGMGPATLVRLLTADGPVGAWQRIMSGEVVRPDRRRRIGASGPTVPVTPSSPVSTMLPWDGAEGESARTLDAPTTTAGTTAMMGTTRTGMTWAEIARRGDPERTEAINRAKGIEVTWWGADDFPSALISDPEPPGVLFWRGDLTWLAAPCVALVGTRRCSPDGRATAFELGRDLSAAGVCVISGLALGIDGAAQVGALRAGGAGTVGVAASGVDVAYPAKHAELWEGVVAHGAVCSETPPGRPAQAWRFPARNRVIAGLSRLVVVVESHATGGSLITAEAALARGIDVMVVPGPVRSPAAAGSNQLLLDGPRPVRHAGDVLDALGNVQAWPPKDAHLRPRRARRAHGGPAGWQHPRHDEQGTPADARPSPTPGEALSDARPSPTPVQAQSDARPNLSPVEAQVLDAVAWRPVTLNHVVDLCALPVGAVAATLDDLEAAGQVASTGPWWCRRAP